MTAEAQWFAAGLAGASATSNATVSIDVPAAQVHLQFHDVDFDEKPFEAPPYYALRVGRWFHGSRLALDLELTHLKVVSRTTATYPATGTVANLPLPPATPMNAIVQRYAMTHGLNFVLISLTARRAFGDGRAAVYVRGGAGPVIPHAETTVLGVAVDRYELAGPGAQVGGGISYRLAGPVSLLGEYRFAIAAPEIAAGDGGTVRMTAVTHQVAFGVSVSGG